MDDQKTEDEIKDVINNALVSSVINYYGHGLFKQLADSKQQLLTQTAMKTITYASFKERAPYLKDSIDIKFYSIAVHFILNNAEHLFIQHPVKSIPLDTSKYGCQDKYQYLPPLDYYLGVNKRLRLIQFYKNLDRGDILICRAQNANNKKLQVLRVVATDAGPHINLIKGLTVTVTLELSKTKVPKIDEASIPNTWMANTLVKVEVLSVSLGTDETAADVTVGTLGETFHGGNPLEICLGKVNRNDVPKIINDIESYTKESVGSFSNCLKKMQSYKNPRAIKHLSAQLGVSMMNSSLMPTLRNGFTAAQEFRMLRKAQLQRWAHKHVADGVEHFKKGEHTEAFQLLKKALDIDSENVEAFVAKGALLANMGSFEKAVEDFESALKYNPEHSNARKYICETLLELGKRYEDENKVGAAVNCYVRSLQVNREHKGCFLALSRLNPGDDSEAMTAVMALLNDKKKISSKASSGSPKVDVSTPSNTEPRADPASQNPEPEVIKLEEDNGKREASLSPLGQKLAMQNNAWKPPSYIHPTKSYIDGGSEPRNSPAQGYSTSVNQAATGNQPRNTYNSDATMAVGSTAQATANSSLEDIQEIRRGKVVRTFVIGKAKASGITDPANLNSERLNIEIPVSIDNRTKKSNNDKTRSNEAAIISDLASKVLSAIASVSNADSPPPYIPAPVYTPAPSDRKQRRQSSPDKSDCSVDVKSDLDIAFDHTMTLKPPTIEDADALSASLLVLSKRYVGEKNFARAKLCLDKSLGENPHHPATLKAVHELAVLTSKPLTMPPSESYTSKRAAPAPKTAPNTACDNVSAHFNSFNKDSPASSSTWQEQHISSMDNYPPPYGTNNNAPRFNNNNAPPFNNNNGPPPFNHNNGPPFNNNGPSYNNNNGGPFNDNGPPYNNNGRPFNNNNDYYGRGPMHGGYGGAPNDFQYPPPSVPYGSGGGPPPHLQYSQRPPDMSAPPPSAGQWGVGGLPPASALEQLSRETSSGGQLVEDKDYHDRVEDFLSRLAMRSQGAPSDDNSAVAGGKHRSTSASRSGRDKRHKSSAQAAPWPAKSPSGSPEASHRRSGKRPRGASKEPIPSILSKEQSRAEKKNKSKSREPSKDREKLKEKTEKRESRSKKKAKDSKKRKRSRSSSGSSDSSRSASSSSSSSSSSADSSASDTSADERDKAKHSKNKKKKSKAKQKRRSSSKKIKVNEPQEKVQKSELLSGLNQSELLSGLNEELIRKIAETISAKANVTPPATEEPKKKKKSDKTKKKGEEKDKKKDEEKPKEKSKKTSVKPKVDTPAKNSSDKNWHEVYTQKNQKEGLVSKDLKPSTSDSSAKVPFDLQVEKIAQKDTSLDIKALMKLSDNLQSKITNYYQMCGDIPLPNAANKGKPGPPPRKPMDPSVFMSTPPSAEIASPAVLTPSGFKATFQPITPKKRADLLPESVKEAQRLYEDILSPAEFRAGALTAKAAKIQKILAKVQEKAETIDRRYDPLSLRPRSRSLGRRSHDRRSRSRDRRSRSRGRRSRDRRSVSRGRRSRSRSRSKSRNRRSRSRDRYRRSRSRDRRSRSRSGNARGRRGGRQYKRSRTKSSSRSRSYSPKEPPPRASKNVKNPRESFKRKDANDSESSPKTAMFGKWAETEERKSSINPIPQRNTYKEMVSYLEDARKKNMEDMKSRNKPFMKKPDL